jgi:tetrahydromethanopterin S-methyltransferase subunit A
MARAIDLELLQLLEDKLGKETARKVAQAIELGLEVMEKRAEELAIQKKLELRDELTKELASKADIQVLKAEIQTVRAEMQAMGKGWRQRQFRAELSAKIENEILRLDRKFTIMFIILFFTLILVNQNALEFLLKVLGLDKVIYF